MKTSSGGVFESSSVAMPPDATSLVIAACALALALLAALASRRARLFWCDARSIPLGTLWKQRGFSGRLPDLTGKTAIVTGANTGVGLEVAERLVQSGATVVIACRDPAKAAAAVDAITSRVGRAGTIRSVGLDLNSLSSVHRTVAQLRRELPALHVLVNNAGVATQFPRRVTADGVESTFQANYLGHVALTLGLLPLLEATAAREGRRARVVHLTSGAHRGAPAEGVPLARAAINGEMGAYARCARSPDTSEHPMAHRSAAYARAKEPLTRGLCGPLCTDGMAKLATLVFSMEIARRHGRHVRSNAVHPGVVASNMLRVDNFVAMLGPILGRVAWLGAQLRNAAFAYSTRTAALSVLYAAVADEVDARDENGELFVPVATRWPPHHAKATDAAFGKALWEFSEALIDAAQSSDSSHHSS